MIQLVLMVTLHRLQLILGRLPCLLGFCNLACHGALCRFLCFLTGCCFFLGGFVLHRLDRGGSIVARLLDIRLGFRLGLCLLARNLFLEAALEFRSSL